MFLSVVKDGLEDSGQLNLRSEISKNIFGYSLAYLLYFYFQGWAKLHFGYMMKYAMLNAQEKCMNVTTGSFPLSMAD